MEECTNVDFLNHVLKYKFGSGVMDALSQFFEENVTFLFHTPLNSPCSAEFFLLVPQPLTGARPMAPLWAFSNRTIRDFLDGIRHCSFFF